ncbi:tRNA (adenosine(37)-N6)-dimethylallyltransferase MiaA [candidate division KSB1 bacterium]|nr:tRNA (adenosine(37)-N6)-dimethylallyltransferase MiaA [candidate division KSB1 bacterium]
MSSRLPTVPVIVGQTASGKTGLALLLAECCDGEIISADSRQIYKYMSIGTAKPSTEQMKRMPHHCVDFLEPTANYSAGQYAQNAVQAIDDVIARNRLPIIVGGSGLYIRALIDGMFEGEIRDQDIRSNLQLRVAEEGLQTLYSELQQCDPIAAQAIHPNNAQRILRALEMFKITGKPRDTLWKNHKPNRKFHPTLLGLYWPRQDLYKRINERVDQMLAEGLIDEVKTLIEHGFGLQHNSMNSLGYKEVFAYLNHEIDLDALRDKIQQNTRRFAKRQMTWFRNDVRIHWIPMHQQNDPDQIVRYIKRNLLSE